MAQVKLLKIDTDGIPVEFSSSDEITLTSFTVNGGGPVLSSTGLDLNNQDVSDVKNLVFNSPTTDTINQTAGNLIVDNIMAKERSNTLTTAADILFPVVTNSSGQLDAFRLPAVAGVPSASPTASGEGFLVWDSTNDDLYVWTGSAWDNQSIVESAQYLDDVYTADEALTAVNAVYISAADNVSKAIASAPGTAQVLGFAISTVSDTNPVSVRKFGALAGFSTLTSGSRYYLDGASAGAITATVPSTSGHTIVQVGYAKNTTTLDINIQNLGRRA